MKTVGTFKFGEFQVDVLTRTLRREEEVIALNRRAFDVLLYLVENPGKIVTRDELLKNVWTESFVDDNSLAQSISALRRALEERPGDNSYIVTLPGRGYQFVSVVQAVAPENGTIVPEVPTAAQSSPSGLIFQKHTIQTRVTTREEELASQTSRTRVPAGLTAALVFVISIAGFYMWRHLRRVPAPGHSNIASSNGTSPVARRSIAVLGFHNLSGRPEEGWLSTAFTEMLSTELAAGEKLRLVSGEDTARAKLELPFADADSLSRNTLGRLHKDLNSDLVVLGSYTTIGEKSDTRIRLDLHLQDTVAGETVADVAVVGDEANLFDMVSQAGAQLREKLGVEAVSLVEAVSVQASLPTHRETARLYSEGLARLRVFDAMGARDLLQQAVAADPKYSMAHSALAEAWSRLGYDKKAQPEARQAYELSANLSREERLLVEGRHRDIDHEYEKAIDVYRTLFTLFPDNLDYGLKLTAMQSRGSKGRDALDTVELLRKLAPPASVDPRIDLAEAKAWDALSDYKHQEEPLARAVEKARAQGARLILARALQNRCWLFRYFGQPQNAVVACRESREIYAAAGDRNGEGVALRNWADAIAQTDAPQSIHLYQEAQIVFRKIGSEIGLTDALSNLSLVYDAQGDFASAEKMQREALAIYRMIDLKRSQAAVIGNIANERMEQGDLPGAIQLCDEALQLDRKLGDTGYAASNIYNRALVYQLQGNLAGARQGFEESLTTWRKNGDQNNSALALSSLGSLLLQQADFSGARGMYGQALAIQTAAGDKLTSSETQLGLADLSLEEAHSPVEQEATMRQAIGVFQQQRSRDDETQAWCILARALFAEGKAADAIVAMQHARSLAPKSQNPEIRWQTAVAAAYLEAAGKDAAHSTVDLATRTELAGIITKSRDLGFQGTQLDARIALAEIEMKNGQVTMGRAHLVAIETDARAKGYNLLARKAALARA